MQNKIYFPTEEEAQSVMDWVSTFLPVGLTATRVGIHVTVFDTHGHTETYSLGLLRNSRNTQGDVWARISFEAEWLSSGLIWPVRQPVMGEAIPAGPVERHIQNMGLHLEDYFPDPSKKG